VNYSLVLRKMYADKAWSVTGNSYDGIVWNDTDPKPTDAELTAQYDSAVSKESAQTEINELKGKLQATDYVALADYDQDKTDVKAERQVWRDRIRELEGQIA
jgi:FtsZ-binding cell division protein ZapB